MTSDTAPCSRTAVVRAGHAGDVATLRRCIDAPEPAVRAAALGGLARAGAIDARDLTRAVADAASVVRRRAAALLGGSDGAELDVDGSLLMVLLDDPDPDVVDWTCWAAGERVGDVDEVVARLVSLATEHPDPIAREAAVAALGSLGHPAGADAVLAACDDVATVRRRAVLALVAFDGVEADAALRRMAEDRDWQVRQAAEELLSIDDPDPTT